MQMGAYPEDELLPISALQHVVFCERQYALIHVEGSWSDNLFTARGNNFHARAHEGKREVRGTVVINFGIPVRSLELGITGITDAVEFRYADRTLSRVMGATPVEYKVGRPKRGNWDIVQVAAQALCLEEMLGIQVSIAYMYYGKTRHRIEVAIDEGMRSRVRAAAQRIHQLMVNGETPHATYDPRKCDDCSLFDICKPRAVSRGSARAFMQAAVRKSLQA